MPNHPVERAPSLSPNVIVVVLATAGITVSLMQTLVIPLVPRLPGLIGTSAADTTWAITTLLAAAVATPVAGRLGDMFGKRRLLLVSLALLAVGLVIAGLAGSVPLFVVGRALRGFRTVMAIAAGAALLALALAAFLPSRPPDPRVHLPRADARRLPQSQFAART
jgi:MFS family permease